MTEARIDHECITARQRAWLATATSDELKVFLSWCEPHVQSLYNTNTGESSYVPCLGGMIVGERQSQTDGNTVLADAEVIRAGFETARATTVVPDWVISPDLSTSYNAQASANYVITQVVDVRSLYVAGEEPVLEIDGESVVAWLYEQFDRSKHSASLQPLWDALGERLQGQITRFYRSEETEDDDLDLTDREREAELSSLVLQAWQRAGLFGYLVQYSMPVRTYYRKDGKLDGNACSLSWGHTYLGWVYTASLEDRSAIDADCAATIAEDKQRAS